MKSMSKDFVRKKDLLWLLTKKEITLRYKRTILGILWSLLNPVILALVLFIAFKIFMKVQMENYAFFLLSGLFPWNWFSSSVIMASGTLVGNAQLMKRILFPRHFLIIATMISQLVNFIFALPVIMVIACISGNVPSLNWLFGIPLLMICQFLATTGISFIVSIVNSYFRDMEYIIGVLLNLLFWMTPIVYPLSFVPEIYKPYLFLNPFTALITAWRNLFMSNTLDIASLGISWLISTVFLSAGIFVFKRFEKKLDEVL